MPEGNIGSAGTVRMRRDESPSHSRASSDFAESFGSSVATVTTGSTRMSRLPWLVWRITLRKPPRDHMRVAQIGLGERDDDRAIVMRRAEIHLPHQAADDPRAVELGARMRGIEGEARHRQSAAALTASDRRRLQNRDRTRPG